ncbi:MAG: EAL domain-containing protein, partial [Thermoanaerobaculia bacterium]
ATGRSGETIVNAIFTMGHALGVRVVAEGVEHPGQRVILRELACDEMQGFVFSPPVPAGEAGRLLKA